MINARVSASAAIARSTGGLKASSPGKATTSIYPMLPGNRSARATPASLRGGGPGGAPPVAAAGTGAGPRAVTRRCLSCATSCRSAVSRSANAHGCTISSYFPAASAASIDSAARLPTSG